MFFEVVMVNFELEMKNSELEEASIDSSEVASAPDRDFKMKTKEWKNLINFMIRLN